MRIPVFLFVPLAACAVDETTSEVDDPITGATALGEPTWSAWLGDCTASILDERWLLTNASCIDADGVGYANVDVTDGSTGMRNVYSGLARKYRHPQHGALAYDLGLIYLDDRGLDLTGIGKAKLYADARVPGAGGESAAVVWAGWGATGAGCTTTTHQLRIVDGLALEHWYDSVDTFWKDGVYECPGDRGSQYLVSRGGELLQHAVHIRQDFIGLIEDHGEQFLPYNFGTQLGLNRAWIEDTIAAETSRAFVTSWTTGSAGGYAYRQANVSSDGFQPLQGYQYRCMDLGKDGSVVLRTCTGSDPQKWAFPVSGAILEYAGPLRRDPPCLAIDSTAVGAHLHVKACDGTNLQRFAYTQDGRLRSAMASTRCLRAGTTDGAAVLVAACESGDPQQMWSTSPIPPP
jgi:hypothetical protein